MKFDAAHVLIIDADTGRRRVECQGDETSDCWQVEDELMGIKKGEECYIAFIYNDLYLRNHIARSIVVPLEIDGWGEDGLRAHLTGRPIIVGIETGGTMVQLREERRKEYEDDDE